MRWQLIFILVLIIGATIYYFSTPKQTRLSDDYQPENIQIQEEDLSDAQERPEDVVVENLVIYAYAQDDKKCETPVAITPKDLDKRYKYQEINAITTLLKGEYPEGYKSVFINGTALNQLRISKGIAYVDLSSFLTIGKGACGPTARMIVLRKTLEQFPDIQGIEFLVDGTPVTETQAL